MDDSTPDFYMGSSENYSLDEIRECYRIKRLHADRRDDYLLIRILPPLDGQRYGAPGSQIDKIVIATRHKGESLFPIVERPIAVYVLRVLIDNPEERDTLRDNELALIGWAEIYPSRPGSYEEKPRDITKLSQVFLVEGGLTYTQTFRQAQCNAFDAENRLISVAVSGQTTQFIYDGDGNLVKKVKPDNSKTIYVGGIYEVDKTAGGSVTRTVTYYPVAGATLAPHCLPEGRGAVQVCASTARSTMC